jgi:hypothetical protein
MHSAFNMAILKERPVRSRLWGWLGTGREKTWFEQKKRNWKNNEDDAHQA